MRAGRRVWLAGVALGGILSSSCGHEPAPVASELIGVWHSASPGYERNAMEFLDHAVVFTAGDNYLTVHPITGFQADREDGFERTRIRFQYSNDGKSLEADLYLSDDGGLVFRNQRAVVWRQPGASTRGRSSPVDPEH